MSIGAPLPRVDAPGKTTGRARYAADHHAPGMLHGTFVTATVPAGTIVGIDVERALAHPGVTAVLTAAGMPRFGTPPPMIGSLSDRYMQDDQVHHEGQPVAIILGESREAVEHGRTLVRVDIERTAFTPHPGPDTSGGVVPRQSAYTPFPTTAQIQGTVSPSGAVPAVDSTYVQASRHHNPIEPSAMLATWDGTRLTVIDSTQHVYGVRTVLAAVFRLPVEQVRVLAPHTGGGFGTKGFTWPHEVLCAAAALVVGRPVRMTLSRADMYSFTGFQPQVVQRVALTADQDGRLTELVHDAVNPTAVDIDWVEYATEAAKGLYASPSISVSQRVQRANLVLPTALRPPWESCGVWAIEAAMNELAHARSIDPLDLRIRNHADVHPFTGRPWSSKRLLECYEQGAAAFGWYERHQHGRVDGDWRIGRGMATCTHGGAPQTGSVAQLRVHADGRIVIEASFQDIGTGTATVLAQLAASVLGVDPAQVDSRMGDTNLPEAAFNYGSTATSSVGAAVMRAADDVLHRLEIERPPDAGPGWDTIAQAMEHDGHREVVGHGEFTPQDTGYAIQTFGAVFVEVGVDVELGLLRLRRVVGRYSVGRVMNRRTARAQMTGGIVWGWGRVALERSQSDPRLGRWLSKNLSGVALPVNADIPADLDIDFIDEVDEIASPIGGKGIGEISAGGVEASTLDAIFDATGWRIRSLPVTPITLLRHAANAPVAPAT